MKYSLTRLLDEAIKIELGISELYQLFSDKILPDRDFWWKLALEEVNHASILKAGKDMLSMGKFPKEIIPDSFEDLVLANIEILESQKRFKDNPDRIKAFELAYEIEISTGEVHYQKYMESTENGSLRKIFRQLNKDDIDHAKRIKEQWDLVLQEI